MVTGIVFIGYFIMKKSPIMSLTTGFGMVLIINYMEMLNRLREIDHNTSSSNKLRSKIEEGG